MFEWVCKNPNCFTKCDKGEACHCFTKYSWAQWDLVGAIYVVPRSWNTSIVLCGSLGQSKNICLLFIYQVDNWKYGWSYTPGTFSLESLFIPVLFVINAIHNNNVTENIYTIHNFQTFCNYIVHYHCRFISIFVSFSPWRWDNGGPCHMLNIESNTTIN